jgi:hypothetical protein
MSGIYGIVDIYGLQNEIPKPEAKTAPKGISASKPAQANAAPAASAPVGQKPLTATKPQQTAPAQPAAAPEAKQPQAQPQTQPATEAPQAASAPVQTENKAAAQGSDPMGFFSGPPAAETPEAVAPVVAPVTATPPAASETAAPTAKETTPETSAPLTSESAPSNVSTLDQGTQTLLNDAGKKARAALIKAEEETK